MGFLSEHSIQWLALDIDGTLYPKRMLNARMIRSLFPSVRLAMAFNWARREYRRVQDREPTIPANREGLLLRQAALVAQRLKEDDLQRCREVIEKQFYGAWRRTFRTIKPFEELRSTLEEIKERGVSIAVLSDFPVEDKLITLGIADLVDVSLSSEESGYLKPSLHPFSLLLSSIGVHAMRVLYIGDSYTKDCQGAKGAGMKTALLGKRPTGDGANADLVASSWKELAAQLL
jgi:putative hydrolase of the HAD superfamily